GVLPGPRLFTRGGAGPGSLLRSFRYVAGEFVFPAGSLTLPWGAEPQRQWVVGELARQRGAENPSRLIASAKSWLSYAGANRTSPILPWGAPEEAANLSPVAAWARYLEHPRRRWDGRVAPGARALVPEPQCRRHRLHSSCYA